ncbi:hypothetical protein LG3211_3831 [Lysobacter gummosus]|nr:hypothetical protein LG3211_3831 [Lysobacter gummosus]
MVTDAIDGTCHVHRKSCASNGSRCSDGAGDRDRYGCVDVDVDVEAEG